MAKTGRTITIKPYGWLDTMKTHEKLWFKCGCISIKPSINMAGFWLSNLRVYGLPTVLGNPLRETSHLYPMSRYPRNIH